MMNNELLEILRSVLNEKLEPFNKRLDAIEQHGKEMNKRLEVIRQDGKEMNKRLDGIDKDLKDLKSGQERLSQNIIESLGLYSEKIADHVDNKTAELNKRVFAVETEI
ncbi:hypothetical protein NDK43_08300 [Neobacillus pocheonensis]|uniref:Uncharacterized protein n=1 Tax=Neobacillus pocheonensis TaxID=363869 RepID=A0ABT0WA98_9BACI|nr:hypothetical protein [Neobacillus pocheonensis]